MKPNRGQLALQALRGDQPVRRFAESLGIGADHVAVWRWLRGLHAPSVQFRIALERQHGIPIGAWEEAADA